MIGIIEVKSAKPMELVRNHLLNFETFDAKIANSLKKSLVTNDQDCVHWKTVDAE